MLAHGMYLCEGEMKQNGKGTETFYVNIFSRKSQRHIPVNYSNENKTLQTFDSKTICFAFPPQTVPSNKRTNTRRSQCNRFYPAETAKK